MKQLFCRYARAKTGFVFSLACFIFALVAQSSWATDPKWYAVQVSATVQAAPAQITLNWPVDSNSQGYTVYRKAPSATSWSQIASLAGNVGTYTDSNVSAGQTYEYQVSSRTPWNYSGYGFVLAGINAPLVDNRGKLILVVDNTYATDLASELSRLQQDLVGDGWIVIRKDVSRNDSVVSVKNVIKSEYNADPQNVKAVFLFGRVPVPYSGNFNPDGHPDHQGAWPADVYYADMDGNWTDNSTYSGGATRSQNKNAPGDGKFDQSDLPSDVELQIGRVDLSNMGKFAELKGQSEKDLLRQYLNKDHNFRMGQLRLQRRGLICDNFGESNGESFAASGWRNFSAFFGANNVTQVGQDQFFPTLGSQDYLWSYGCGGGSYYTCYGVGAIEDFARTDIKSVFTMLLGSYFGDWDADSDFLRGPLCSQTYGLVSVWAGRPHWFVHQMGLGETIGYSAKLTQNNGNGKPYAQVNYGSRGVHVALMGDPTLRMHPVLPVSNLKLSGGVLTWSASGDSDLQGYHVYRANSANGPFTRLTSSPVTANSYTDNSASGSYTYMVRAIKLEKSGSGTYYNASQGVFINGNSTGNTGGDTTVTNTVPSVTNTVPPVVTNTNPPVVTNTVPSATNSVPTNTVPGSAGTSAAFVKTDSTTQGAWKNVYGSEGYIVMGDATSSPGYAQVSASGKADWTWQWSTTDKRAVQKASNPNDRIAGCWYADGTFTVDLNFNDGNAHRVAFYCLDWDNNGRVQKIEVLDSASGNVLDAQTVSGFGGGKYLIWDLQGKVKVRFTRNTGYNAEVSGIFFDGGASTTAPAPETKPEPTPAPAPIVISAPVISPNGGTFTNSVNVTLASATSGANIRYTLDGSQPTWTSPLYSASFVLTNSATVKAIAYASGTNSTVSSASFTKAVIVVPPPVVTNTPPTTDTNTPPSTNVVTAPNQARFVTTDASTKGDWRNAYGSEGYNLFAYSAANPRYAEISGSGNTPWVWQWSTSDSRGLQKPGTTDREATCWYGGSSYTINVNLTDGKFHRVALYALDWDRAGRTQTVEVLDADSGAVLHSQTLSNFADGKYLVWDLKGRVKIRLTRVSGPNAVSAGLFFSASPAS